MNAIMLNRYLQSSLAQPYREGDNAFPEAALYLTHHFRAALPAALIRAEASFPPPNPGPYPLFSPHTRCSRFHAAPPAPLPPLRVATRAAEWDGRSGGGRSPGGTVRARRLPGSLRHHGHGRKCRGAAQERRAFRYAAQWQSGSREGNPEVVPAEGQ